MATITVFFLEILRQIDTCAYSRREEQVLFVYFKTSKAIPLHKSNPLNMTKMIKINKLPSGTCHKCCFLLNLENFSCLIIYIYIFFVPDDEYYRRGSASQ
jgi:hypothetical protein